MGHFKEKFQLLGTQKETVQQKRSRACSTDSLTKEARRSGQADLQEEHHEV